MYEAQLAWAGLADGYEPSDGYAAPRDHDLVPSLNARQELR